MTCPHCGSTHIRRDYAPSRAYALLGMGLALLFFGRYIQPSVFNIPLPEIAKFITTGGLLAALGIWDLLRHGNRFCATCGFRFRAPLACRTENTCTGAPMSLRKTESAPPPDPRHTPIEPLLACLRFKNERMRHDALATLRRLTNQDLGEDAEAWERWWQENKERYEAERGCK